MSKWKKIAACGCVCLMVFSVTGSSCRIQAEDVHSVKLAYDSDWGEDDSDDSTDDDWDDDLDDSWDEDDSDDSTDDDWDNDDLDDSWDDDDSDDSTDDNWDDDTDADDEDDNAAATVAPSPTVTSSATTTTASKKASLNYTSLQLKKGAKKKLKTSNVKGKVTWSSSSKKVATVSKKGVVKAKKAGKATIRVKNSKGKQILSCKVTVYKKITPAAAKKKILSLKSKYKEGKAWDNSNYYFWRAINTQCYGCIAFAGKISDTVFGKNAAVKRHKKFAGIKTGDHIRIGDYHSVVALTRKGNKITVVEGNYNSSIHWGRTITKAELAREGFYVETRY